MPLTPADLNDAAKEWFDYQGDDEARRRVATEGVTERFGMLALAWDSARSGAFVSGASRDFEDDVLEASRGLEETVEKYESEAFD